MKATNHFCERLYIDIKKLHLLIAMAVSFLCAVIAMPLPVAAKETAVINITQGSISGGNSVGGVSDEQYINNLDGIDYLSISLGNLQIHYYCERCSGSCAGSTVTVKVYGYTKSDFDEEEIKTYSISGLDGNSARTGIYRLMITDTIREKYAYLKVSATLGGISLNPCSHNEKSNGFFLGSHGYAAVSVNEYDTPIIKVNGNLFDITVTEGTDSCIGNINAYYPSGEGKYIWQYSEGSDWKSLIDGTYEYTTSAHGKISLTDISGGNNFSSSCVLNIKNPSRANSGISFRVLLQGEESTSVTQSEAAKLTVVSRDAESFYSARYALRYGQVGENVSIDDIIAYVKFNNGKMEEVARLRTEDARAIFYGLVKPIEDGEYSSEEVVERLNNGSMSATVISENSNDTVIKEGMNTFYIMMTYCGNQTRSIYEAISFSGIDEMPPIFDESVMLYEYDGSTPYVRGNYKLSDEEATNLYIKGEVTDSVSDEKDISWAYTLSEAKDASNNISIPVYRMGGNIDIAVKCNGLYTVFSKDNSGNTASKSISVQAFDENYPQMNYTVEGLSDSEGGTNVFNTYSVSIVASDKEKLATKPYLYKRFDSDTEARLFNVHNVPDTDYSSKNSFSVNQPGYYLIAVRDAVGKITSEYEYLPREGAVLDNERPSISIVPLSTGGTIGKLTEYNVIFADNRKIRSYSIEDEAGNNVITQYHNHDVECSMGKCEFYYTFNPSKEGRYTIRVTDEAGNVDSLTLNVARREAESFEIAALPDTMAVNTTISMQSLIDGNRIIIHMNDGSMESFSKDEMTMSCRDNKGNSVDIIRIDYGENKYSFTVDFPGKAGKSLKYEWTVFGEDNVAPIPGSFEVDCSEGWDGTLTNNTENKVTLRAVDMADDGSDTANLIVTWYRDDNEISKKSVAEGGDVLGPFAGEDYNGVYRYVITDEKGNAGYSTSERIIDCWDTTPPTGEVKLLPDGTTADSLARYKQIQIVNAADNRGLSARPYSFKGDNEDTYSAISSIVAGENESYEIYLKDSVGNVAHLQGLTLTGIDSVSPVINGYEFVEKEEGLVLVVDATDTDSTGSDKSDSLTYSIDGENYQAGSEFAITESGNYTIYVKDEAGNITKTGTDYTDTVGPSITAAQDESGAGIISIKVSDDIGLSRLTMTGPDGLKEILQVYDGAGEDTVSKEIDKKGLYTFTVTDMAGNSESCEVNVESIAAACSASILTGLKITPEGWTAGDVTVIAQLSDTTGLAASPFRWNGSIPTSQPYVIVTENGETSVEISDKYGNVITSGKTTVTNIDRIAPIMANLTQSEDKNHIAVNVSDTGSGIAQITISGGPYSVETGAVKLDNEMHPDEILITLPTNGTYTVRAYDAAGNSCQKQITAEGVTTDIAKVVTKEVVKEIPVETTVDRVVTQERVVTQNVPVIVPVPTKEEVVVYKTLRENGEDTGRLITDDDGGDKDDAAGHAGDESQMNEKIIEKSLEENYAAGEDKGTQGYRTADGTYIGPDGYEYFNRVDPLLKKDNPLKYWFKKNAEAIAAAACILCIVLLAVCIIMGSILIRDYVEQEKHKSTLKGRKQ